MMFAMEGANRSCDDDFLGRDEGDRGNVVLVVDGGLATVPIRQWRLGFLSKEKLGFLEHREKHPCTVSFPSNRAVLDSETV
ncbi:hypothetical protein LR48_Vigan03g125500 [Vigna angularis]|uniref:Uncharacterized protein n=1 Tax=Phaseolus angularis TaxID=3914 RepID=A0A0L9U4X1_PHAAN|nr:hypothetical protein LR48_Vigan03g125500 [Vigna angularis]